MAKKKESTSLIEALSEFKELKNIDKNTMIQVLEDSFRNVLSKMFGSDDTFSVIINLEKKGDFEIWRTRRVVADEEVTDTVRQVALSEAQSIDPDVALGEDFVDAVDFSAFGRRAVINLRQALASKILELQKDNFYHNFIGRVGELVSAEVYQVWKREALLIDDEGNEMLMPKSEQIPGDFFRKGETIRAVIARVENENSNPKVILSRVSPEFLKRLLELNVPEIADGLITIRAAARVPGERAKIAVESYDDRIDPVGACVGVNGSRIRSIVRELKGENIDVTTYTTNTLLFIQRALSPAKAVAITLDEETKQAEVYMRPDQVPLAIGKNAANLKLASLLTGYRIEVFRDGDAEEDIYLDEFDDEIEGWIITQLKDRGYTTAKSILRTSREELLRVTDLEEDTLDNVLAVLEAEFADEEEEDEEGDENTPAESAEDNQ
ncbi:transcription termination factor NusA [Porphyromonas catoniae]|jgi:transcription termination factor nusA|uniref:Transcription termination/antitermination protein NusA n=1 Tax=Porphyromonas catoniae F0037 TaxID=1127696 RepID=L1NAE9_9PORP|nr:transcription termination factor NusA [Porphyromonas catoniae]EKY00187.1 transcription termination factor NusA [Porphyromonas catoniae F0037]